MARPPVTFEDAIDALRAVDVHVVGVFSGPPTYGDDLLATVTESGSIEIDGTPVFVDLARNGEGVDDAFVGAVGRFLWRVPLAVTLDVDTADGDVLDVRPRSAVPFAATRLTETGFENVLPGARLVFEVDVRVTWPTTVQIVTRAGGREALAVETIAIERDDMCRFSE